MNKGLLRNGPLRALLVAEVISTTGSQMTWLALPWFVLTTSGSATRMSVVVAAEVIGMGLMTLPGTRLLSHFGARRGDARLRRLPGAADRPHPGAALDGRLVVPPPACDCLCDAR